MADSARFRPREDCDRRPTIGTNNTKRYEPDDDEYRTRLYLNTAMPASCSGTVRNWTFCYYVPSGGRYQAQFAVYRRASNLGPTLQYFSIQPSARKYSITISVEDNNNESSSSNSQSSSDSDVDFQCAVYTPSTSIAVNRGDVIGVILSGDGRLDIVSNTGDSELNADTIHYRDYDHNIPGIIVDPREIQSRVIHLFAEVDSKFQK